MSPIPARRITLPKYGAGLLSDRPGNPPGMQSELKEESDPSGS